MKYALCLVTLAAAFALVPLSADCHAGGWHGYYPSPYASLHAARLFRSDRLIPYFADPPVYYSHPVARPYGYSPFAYPPCNCGHSYAAHDAISIPNPHAPAGEPVPESPAPEDAESQPVPESTSASTRGPQPLVVLNPYVEQPQRLADERGR